MEILKDVKQIEEKLKSTFGFEIDIDIERFVKENLTELEINFLADNIKNKQINIDDVNLLSDLIFQLRNYLNALSNLIKLLLISKNYESVFFFVKKIFVGQIGQIRYSSTKLPYTFIERYFDRFIEIVKNCDIDRNLYLPLIIKAFESDKTEILYNWKRPAIEFMQNFFNENEDWTISYINSNNENKYKLLEIITDFNTSRGIKMLIDDYISDNSDQQQNSHILKKYKRETFLELDKRLYGNISEEEKERLSEVFIAFGSDNEALSRLNDLYEKATSPSLKLALAERLEIIKSPEVKTEKQFVYAARRKIKDPQERTLGVPFDKINLNLKSGFPANNVVKTYLINVFKEENNLSKLSNLNYLKNVFQPEGLNDFAEKLFEVLSKKEDIKEAKWAIRFCSVLADEKLIKEICNFDCMLFAYNRIKEAKYLTECLASCGREEVISVFASEIFQKFEDEDWKQNVISILSKKANINMDDIEDALATEKTSESNFEKQKNRLYSAFLDGREFEPSHFNSIAIKQPFVTLFKKLIWGEYKGEKLYNAFLCSTDDEGNFKRNYLIKLLNEDEQNFKVKILHTLDLDDRFEKITDAIQDPLFKQFKKIKFDVKDFKPQTTEIGNFNGMFINAEKFVNNIQQFGFNINRNEGEITFGSLININEDLKIACVLEFNKPINLNQAYSNLGNVMFFKTKDLLLDGEKYIYSKNNAMSAPSVPSRFFDYCLTSVVTSLQG